MILRVAILKNLRNQRNQAQSKKKKRTTPKKQGRSFFFVREQRRKNQKRKSNSQHNGIGYSYFCGFLPPPQLRRTKFCNKWVFEKKSIRETVPTIRGELIVSTFPRPLNFLASLTWAYLKAYHRIP